MNFKKKQYCIFGTGGFGRETLICLTDSIASSDYRIGEIMVFMVDDAYYNESEI